MKTRQIKAGKVYTGHDGEVRHVLDVDMDRNDFFVRYCVWRDPCGVSTGTPERMGLLDFANWAKQEG